MPSFHEVQFPPDISYGAAGGPGYSTTIVTTSAGFEKRNQNWSQARGKWNVEHGVKTLDQVAVLIAFFRARKGRAHGFRFKDWTDFQGTGEVIGTGNGSTTAFQLTKTYSSGPGGEVRPITKPVAGTVVLYLDGAPQASGWSVNTTTGLVTFSAAPGTDVQVAADYEFDVPCRFDSDEMNLTIEAFELGTWGSITLVELRQ